MAYNKAWEMGKWLFICCNIARSFMGMKHLNSCLVADRGILQGFVKCKQHWWKENTCTANRFEQVGFMFCFILYFFHFCEIWHLCFVVDFFGACLLQDFRRCFLIGSCNVGHCLLRKQSLLAHRIDLETGGSCEVQTGPDSTIKKKSLESQ